MLVRQMMRENSHNVQVHIHDKCILTKCRTLVFQVIMMSATLEVNRMSDYFIESAKSFSLTDQPGQVNIAIPSHEVAERYLDDFAESYLAHVSSVSRLSMLCLP